MNKPLDRLADLARLRRDINRLRVELKQAPDANKMVLFRNTAQIALAK